MAIRCWAPLLALTGAARRYRYAAGPYARLLLFLLRGVEPITPLLVAPTRRNTREATVA